MIKLVIDGSVIKNKGDLHNTIKTTLSFPEWYGNNLDAMFDCLTDLSEEAAVTFVNFAMLRENLGRYADNTKKVFLNAAKENPRINVETQKTV